MHRIFLIDLSTFGHSGCSGGLVIINSAGVNLGAQILLSDTDLASFRYLLRRGIAGPFGSAEFNILRDLHALFRSGCTNLHKHKQCARIPLSPLSCQHLLSSVSLSSKNCIIKSLFQLTFFFQSALQTTPPTEFQLCK